MPGEWCGAQDLKDVINGRLGGQVRAARSSDSKSITGEKALLLAWASMRHADPRPECPSRRLSEPPKAPSQINFRPVHNPGYGRKVALENLYLPFITWLSITAIHSLALHTNR